MALFRAYIDAILSTGKPVIARINGIAVGGGNETVLACDLAVIAEHAYVGQVGVRVGSVACGGATQWLPITVGDKRAREMLFTNRPIPARLALEWGLVNRVAPSVRRGGDFVEQRLARGDREGAEGARTATRSISRRLDEEVDRLAQELLRDVPRVRALHEAADELLEGLLLGADRAARAGLAGAPLHRLRAASKG